MASQWMIDLLNKTSAQTGQQPVAPTPTSVPSAQLTPVGRTQMQNLYTGVAKKAQAGLGRVGEASTWLAERTEEAVTGLQKRLNLVPQTAKTYEEAGWGKLSTPMRFIADPLNLLGGIGKIPKVGKAIPAISKSLKLAEIMPTISKLEPIQKVAKFAKETPAIYKPIEAISPYFRNPEAGRIIEETKRVGELRTNQLFRQVSEAAKGLNSAAKVRVGQLLEGEVSISKGEERIRAIANEFKKVAEQVGKEAVDQGLLNPESYAKLKGKYMSHIWDTALTGENPLAKISEVPKIAGQFFQKRKGAEGYIKEFAEPVFKGLGTEMRDIEATKMYKQIAQKFGKEMPVTAEEVTKLGKQGYIQAEDIAKSRGGEILNKKLVPKEIVDYINRSGIAKTGEIKGVYDQAMRAWKAGKTIWNPAYHVRNIISNQILSEAQTGRGLPRTIIDYLGSVRNYLGKGSQQFANEAIDTGLIKRKSFGERLTQLSELGKNKEPLTKLKQLFKTPERFQQFSEDTAKLNVFTQLRKEGKTVDEARKLAEEAIFSPYNLSKAEKGIMGAIFPFYSFTRQALPFITKKLVTHPERFTKYPKMEQAVERLTEETKPDETNLPPYMKEMVRVPSKTKKGLQEYLNLQYFYPWGSFLEQASGLPTPTFGLGVNPLLEEYTAQKTGIDPYFKSEFIREGMPKEEQLKARVGHAATTFLPSPYRSIAGKILPALQGRPDYAGRERDLGKVVGGEVSGLKLYPYDIQAGTKSKGYQRYKIQDDYDSERKRVIRDQSLTPEERRKKLDAIFKRYQERLKEFQSQ